VPSMTKMVPSDPTEGTPASTQRTHEMTQVEQHDGFDRALAAVPACSLDGCGAGAQKERYRAIAPFITRVREEAMTVVVEFAGDVDVAVLDEMLAVENQCCSGVLGFELDGPARSLAVTAADPADKPALGLIASGFRPRLGR
jgi:hypothetical protein